MYTARFAFHGGVSVEVSEAISRLHPRVLEARRALLCGPVEVDGDSIGACLALAAVLRRVNPALETVVASAEAIPRQYAFLPGVDEFVRPAAVRGAFDLALVLDGVRHRIGDVGETFDAASTRVLVDHHQSADPRDYDLALLDPLRASTCEIVHQIARHPLYDVPLDRDLAQQLYTGMAYDTGVFRYSCTTPATLRVAAELLEAGIDAQQIIERLFLDTPFEETLFRGRILASAQRFDGDRIAVARVPLSLRDACAVGPGATDGVVNDLVFVVGVEVGCLLVEQAPGRVKVSMRSRGGVNVAVVARGLSASGGGHERAAGVTLDASLDEVTERVVGSLRRALRAD